MEEAKERAMEEVEERASGRKTETRGLNQGVNGSVLGVWEYTGNRDQRVEPGSQWEHTGNSGADVLTLLSLPSALVYVFPFHLSVPFPLRLCMSFHSLYPFPSLCYCVCLSTLGIRSLLPSFPCSCLVHFSLTHVDYKVLEKCHI